MVFFSCPASSGPPKDRKLEFTGLVPTQESQVRELRGLCRRLAGLRGQIHWLQSVRKHWQRLVTKTGRSVRAIGSDGDGAAEILVTHPSVLAEVRRWYAGEQIGRSLEVREFRHPHSRILLNPAEGPLNDIDLLDTGEGMVQAMPVLVAAALARAAGPRAVLAVEEPETHLHGNAQRALAEHLAEMAASDHAPTVVVETHSRLLLLGIQLAVAKGSLPSDRVCVFWVDQEPNGSSSVSRVELTSEGRPKGGWPRSAFADDQELADQLVALQQKRGALG